MAISQSDIKEKIKKLKEYWLDDEGSLKWIDGVEKRLRAMVIKEKLVENKAIIDIVDDAKKKISAIDVLLRTDESLSDIERKLLFREKKVFNFFLDRLDGKDLDRQFERVGQLLDTELKSAGLMKDEE